jgi:hypothetical protein
MASVAAGEATVGATGAGEGASLARAAWPAQLFAAVRLSIEFALAALVTVPLAALYDKARLALQLRFGRGVFVLASFDVDYVHRERVIVTEDHSTVWARHKMLNGALPVSCLVLYCTFPFVYAQYLGGTRRVYAMLAGAAALTWGSVELGFVVLGIEEIYSYAPLLGFVILAAVLRLVCPTGSRVPAQALKQMVLVGAGNVLMVHVSVGTSDLDRFLNLFVVLNVFREAGRMVLNKSVYYLTIVRALAWRPSLVAASDPTPCICLLPSPPRQGRVSRLSNDRSFCGPAARILVPGGHRNNIPS